MPSWPVHIALARKLNKKLNLDDNFIIGNILPDVLNGFIIKDVSQIVDTRITHYRSKVEDTLSKDFIYKYKNKIDNPIVLGYLCHILTDNYFNDYFYKNHTIFKDNKRLAILNDGSIYYNADIKPWQMKQADFHLFGKKLTNKDLLGDEVSKMNDTFSLTRNLKEIPFTDDDINKAILKINELINTKYIVDDDYKMFTENELTKLYNDCYDYIIKFLKTL